MTCVACRVCASNLTTKLGTLPDTTEFAGNRRDDALRGGSLYECNECGLLFRHPLLTPAEYDLLYTHGSSIVWESIGQREDFRLVREALADHRQGAAVLDIGCFTGQLLASLPPDIHRFGIEPNVDAAKIASNRNIEILASSYEHLPNCPVKFDAIVACDFIEHVPNPLAFLQLLRNSLRDGGRIIITTGDSDCWLWRRVRANFWYCYYPEHISFIGTRWLRALAPKAGLHANRVTSFNYRPVLTSTRRLAILLTALAYAAAPDQFKAVSRFRTADKRATFSPPGCGATEDHVFCVLQPVN